MNARTGRTEPAGRLRLLGAVARSLTPALLVLTGLATTTLGFAWFAGADVRVHAYRTAPVCGPAAVPGPGTHCVRHERGTVTAKATHAGAGPSAGDPDAERTVTVAREAAPTRTFSVGAAFYVDVEIGATVDLTVYRGHVAAIAYQGHRADTPSRLSLAVLLGVMVLVGLGVALASHGLSWPRLGPSAARFAAVGAVAAVLAFFGGFALMWIPLPPDFLLALPVLLWLVVTAAATAVTWNDRPSR
ncbi:hypothetical protein GCM10009639_18600 [Kitasatospora putterlickiae]|uniref:Integral membrane protein n=1 Tax=Kitasatospora putterlickiae TaxID=221725 RepID=A0ABP4IGV3_9ACTN